MPSPRKDCGNLKTSFGQVTQLHEGFFIHWFAEQIALMGVTAMVVQKSQLFFGFHAFSDDFQIEVMCQVDDGFDQCSIMPINQNVLHESRKRPVDDKPLLRVR